MKYPENGWIAVATYAESDDIAPMWGFGYTKEQAERDLWNHVSEFIQAGDDPWDPKELEEAKKDWIHEYTVPMKMKRTTFESCSNTIKEKQDD